MRAYLTLPLTALPILAVPVLAGCAGSSPLPGKEPVDALGSMYTTTAAPQVAACIARSVGGAVQANGASYTVTSGSGTSYNIGPNEAKSVYPVLVVVHGTTVLAHESEQVALCLRNPAVPGHTTTG